MVRAMEQDEHGNWYLKVPLIGDTKRRLDQIVEEIGDTTAPAVAASMLHDILEDDESCHVSPGMVPLRDRTIN